MNIGLSQTDPAQQQKIRNLLQKLSKAMVDSSKGVIDSHKALRNQLNGPDSQSNQDKLGKIQDDISSTVDSFRQRLASLINDMKYLTEKKPIRDKIENVSKGLENTPLSVNPIQLGKDMDDLADIIAPHRPRIVKTPPYQHPSGRSSLAPSMLGRPQLGFGGFRRYPISSTPQRLGALPRSTSTPAIQPEIQRPIDIRVPQNKPTPMASTRRSNLPTGSMHVPTRSNNSIFTPQYSQTPSRIVQAPATQRSVVPAGIGRAALPPTPGRTQLRRESTLPGQLSQRPSRVVPAQPVGPMTYRKPEFPNNSRYSRPSNHPSFGNIPTRQSFQPGTTALTPNRQSSVTPSRRYQNKPVGPPSQTNPEKQKVFYNGKNDFLDQKISLQPLAPPKQRENTKRELIRSLSARKNEGGRRTSGSVGGIKTNLNGRQEGSDDPNKLFSENYIRGLTNGENVRKSKNLQKI